MLKSRTLPWLFGALLPLAPLHAAPVTYVARPSAEKSNPFYVSNRAPLIKSPLVKLPAGSVQGQGWLKELMNRQSSGLTGHLGEISAWLQKEDNAWLSKDGKGKYGWEELPYWLRGYQNLAYQMKDPKMIAEAKTWIEGALNSQRPDGDFGPLHYEAPGVRDFWANMVMLYCLEDHYDRTGDKRVIALMTKYFQFQNSLPDEKLIPRSWQHVRGGDNLYSVYWLYNRTGDKFLLDFANKLDRVTLDWNRKDRLPNLHNVNVAQGFREPATRYQQTKKKEDLQASYDVLAKMRRTFGPVPGGMWGGDENSRPGYKDPRQAVETCGMVEQMLSDEIMNGITGDTFWSDHAEEVAFNSLPVAFTQNFGALRYLTAPNMALSDDRDHSPGIDNSGPFLMMNPFSSRCCQHNHSMGWPYFAEHSWMATPDSGLYAAIYAPSTVTAKVGNGTTVQINETTQYPFRDTLTFAITTPKAVSFPLYLRVPAWCSAPAVAINGRAVRIDAPKNDFIRIARNWKSGDRVTLRLPFELKVTRYEENKNSASVAYGPLTFSLKFNELYETVDSTKTAIGDSQWQKDADPAKWPSTIIRPGSPWNYALELSGSNPAKSFTVETRPWPADNYPFSTESAPIVIKAKGRKVPEWKIDQYGLVAPLQQSPVKTSEPLEDLTLIPMGSARLRISAFPVVGTGANATQWKENQPAMLASRPFPTVETDWLTDASTPKNSNDHDIPRFTWWANKGTAEWIEMPFDKPRPVSEVSLYWFDDTGRGECRIPQSWRLLYKDGNDWKPVQATDFGVKKDTYNTVSFPTVTTTALRIEAQLQPNVSSGILKWRVK